MHLYEYLNYWPGKANSLDVIAQISRIEKKYKLSQGYYTEAINMYEVNGDSSQGLLILYLNYSALLNEMKLYDEGLARLYKAKQIFNINGLEDQWLLNINIADAYNGMGINDSAFIYIEKAIAIKNDIYDSKKAEAIVEMETKYGTRKLEAVIITQKVENQYVREKAEQLSSQRKFLLFFLLFAIIIFIIGYLYFHQRQKATRTISLQKQKIQDQKIQSLLKTQELTAINSMLEGQENERIRIAKDLHDRLGSMLTTVKWSFGQLYGKKRKK